MAKNGAFLFLDLQCKKIVGQPKWFSSLGSSPPCSFGPGFATASFSQHPSLWIVCAQRIEAETGSKYCRDMLCIQQALTLVLFNLRERFGNLHRNLNVKVRDECWEQVIFLGGCSSVIASPLHTLAKSEAQFFQCFQVRQTSLHLSPPPEPKILQ